MKFSALTFVTCVLLSISTAVLGQIARPYEIVISEIFADPSPSVGLPASEFIEIKNVSTSTFDLKDWRFGDESSIATISASHFLQPDSIVIICTNAATIHFSHYGRVIGVSNFPSLDNDADQIFLRSKEGNTIHTVRYTNDWYQNAIKTNGGWTLEMIDTKNPCAGKSNWKASTDANGGTPGKKNSVEARNQDDVAPALVRTYTIDSITIVAVFDEPVDSISASTISKFRLDNNIQPVAAIPVAPLFNEVILKLSTKLLANSLYHLTVSNINDCTGNSVGIKNQTRVGLAVPADSFDIVINEILFNPKSDGFDYIELYNKSNKTIDLQHFYISNRNITGGLRNIQQLSVIPYLFFPGDYITFTENLPWLSGNYNVKNTEAIHELPTLPSLPDDKGTIVVTNVHRTIDELHYDTKWHFALINNDEGIALERIDYRQPTQNKNNWTSAASTAAYGTPGYQNSQFRADLQVQGMITMNPKIFSPDNDGFNDFTTIEYQMTEPGYVASITIFDANGRPVRHLANNATLALQGNFRWDGLDNKLQQLPVGMYIVLTEIFNLSGKTKKFKSVVTLARRL